MTEIPKQTFWMVYGMGQGAPTVRHQTFESAQREAKRLARQVPDGVFVVLEAVEAIFKREFDVVRLREPHETYRDGLRQPPSRSIDACWSKRSAKRSSRSRPTRAADLARR